MDLPTGPPPISLSVTLAAAGRRAQHELDAALSGLGLSMRHLGALGHLGRDENLSVSDLARRAGITPQSMHATINELERAGALTRTAAGRGRRAEVRVTPEGRRMLASGMAAVDDVDARLDAELGLTPAELTRLVAFGFGSRPDGGRAP